MKTLTIKIADLYPKVFAITVRNAKEEKLLRRRLRQFKLRQVLI